MAAGKGNFLSAGKTFLNFLKIDSLFYVATNHGNHADLYHFAKEKPAAVQNCGGLFKKIIALPEIYQLA